MWPHSDVSNICTWRTQKQHSCYLNLNTNLTLVVICLCYICASRVTLCTKHPNSLLLFSFSDPDAWQRQPNLWCKTSPYPSRLRLLPQKVPVPKLYYTISWSRRQIVRFTSRLLYPKGKSWHYPQSGPSCEDRNLGTSWESNPASLFVLYPDWAFCLFS